MEEKASVNQEFCVIYNSDNFDQIVNSVTKFLKENKTRTKLNIQKLSHKGKNMIIQWSWIPFGMKKIESTTELSENELLIINGLSLVPICIIPENHWRIDNSLQENADKK